MLSSILIFSSTVVATILESGQWHQALQFCSRDDPKHIVTPLRRIILKMPGSHNTYVTGHIKT